MGTFIEKLLCSVWRYDANILTTTEAAVEVSVAVCTHTIRSLVGPTRFSPHPIVRPRVVVTIRVHYRVDVPVVHLTQRRRDVITVRVTDQLMTQHTISDRFSQVVLNGAKELIPITPPRE